MNILICGDIVGRSGREIIYERLPSLRKENDIDFVIVNGENAASGFGITKKICESFYNVGVDVITTGNHVWDQKEVISYIDSDNRLIRPINYPKNTPGKGMGVYMTNIGIHVVVINVMCRLFMDALDNPFERLNSGIEVINSQYSKKIIIVDVHGEATSEKMAIGHYLDGKVSAVVGTHTHVPTADLHILEKGTFYQTDLGMCGDYDSVVGMKKEFAVSRFISKHIKTRLEPASGEATLCGTILKINQNDMFVEKFRQILIGGKLG